MIVFNLDSKLCTLFISILFYLFIYEIKLQLFKKFIRRSCFVMVQSFTLWSYIFMEEKLAIKNIKKYSPIAKWILVTSKHNSQTQKLTRVEKKVIIYSGIMQVYKWRNESKDLTAVEKHCLYQTIHTVQPSSKIHDLHYPWIIYSRIMTKPLWLIPFRHFSFHE